MTLSRFGLERGGLKDGLVSGFATGLFSIPEGMAYAQLAGVSPIYGLYSGIVATLASALTTGSVLMISTLTSAIALSTASVIEVAGIEDAQMPRALFTITLLVGGIMFVMGLLRLGSLVNFVPHAVMTGFVAGASMLIIIGELGDFSGYAPSGSNKLAKLLDWLANIGQWDPSTAIVGTVTVVLMIGMTAFTPTKRVAGVLALMVMTFVVWLLAIDSVELVGDVAAIPKSLPMPMLPAFGMMPKLALGSVSVALVALVQGAGISAAYPNPDGSRADQSRDFIGQGLGNLAGSFFQSMATGGSLSRTGINVNAGGSSRWGGIFAAVWLAVLVVLFGSVAELVPLPVIGGLLFVVAAEILIARFPAVVMVFRASWRGTVSMLITFFSALFIPLQWTIFVGAGLSFVVYLYATSRSLHVFEIFKGESGRWEERDLPEVLESDSVIVIGNHAAGFFAEVPRFRELLPETQDTRGSVMIWRMREIEQVHSTFIRMVTGFATEFVEGGNQLMLAGVQPEVMNVLVKTEAIDIIGAENIFGAEPGIGASMDAAHEAATQWVSQHT